jgi:hypothetical protein
MHPIGAITDPNFHFFAVRGVYSSAHVDAIISTNQIIDE